MHINVRLLQNRVQKKKARETVVLKKRAVDVMGQMDEIFLMALF